MGEYYTTKHQKIYARTVYIYIQNCTQKILSNFYPLVLSRTHTHHTTTYLIRINDSTLKIFSIYTRSPPPSFSHFLLWKASSSPIRMAKKLRNFNGIGQLEFGYSAASMRGSHNPEMPHYIVQTISIILSNEQGKKADTSIPL